MAKSVEGLLFLGLCLFSTLFVSPCLGNGDVGTAGLWNISEVPYITNPCGVNPLPQLFAAVGKPLWNNGAACGDVLKVKCLIAAAPRTCIPGQIVEVVIIGCVSSNGTLIFLSTTAMGSITYVSTTAMGNNTNVPHSSPVKSSVRVEYELCLSTLSDRLNFAWKMFNLIGILKWFTTGSLKALGNGDNFDYRASLCRIKSLLIRD
ncbi:RlpA-like domain superfamily [Sesbania bispinosa]|nr:RlpA-like domain superfamily [Sesbania bispinosa]